MKKNLSVKTLMLLSMMIIILTAMSFTSCKSSSVVVLPEPEEEKTVSDVRAKKPVIMIIPSDAYCSRNGYVTEWVDENGNVNKISDVSNIFIQDDVEDLRLVISELSKIMAERGFPLKDLEQTLKSIQQESVEMSLLESSSGAYIYESMFDKVKRTAKADMILDLDFVPMQKGPQRYISYNLRALDAYTNKVIAANSGVGSPSISAPINLLLEEAVLNFIDSFCAQLMSHFDDMAKNGREIVLKLKLWDSSDITFEEEFEFEDEYIELTDIISYWMEDNTVNHAPTRTNATENFIAFEQVRIPLYKERNGKQSALDARGFANSLRSYLKKEPFLIDSKIYERGLGEVWIVIGEE